MPSFPWSKKGSQPSVANSSETYDRSSSRIGPPLIRPNYAGPAEASQETRSPISSTTSQSLRQPNQRTLGGAPYHLHTASTPPHSDKSSPNSAGPQSPIIDTRPDAEPRRTFKERLGLSSSRENLLDVSEDNARGGLRRKLSSRRKDARNPTSSQHTSPTEPLPTAASAAPQIVPRRATVATRQVGGGTNPTGEADELRDFANFLRTTAPPSDPQRRPFSFVGNPSAGQAYFSGDTAGPGNFSIPRRARTSSLDNNNNINNQGQQQQQQQGDDRVYGIAATTDKEDEDPYTLTPSISQGGVFSNPSQEPSPTTGQAYSESQYTIHRHPLTERRQLSSESSSNYPLNSNESVQQPAGQTEADTYIAHLQSQRNPNNASAFDTEALPQQRAGLSLMPTGLQPPMRRGSQDGSEPSTPGFSSRMQQQLSQQQLAQQAAGQGISGRRTPEPPGVSGSDMSEQEANQLARDYKELREKYSKVKRYYFEKEDQVKTLQNALAHQKLASSRTSLDDGEYVSRLTRLDGLISQLAYGFRKDWVTTPNWLMPYVNRDCVSTGKQEMTALGRAFVSRWLSEEVFERYFHPGLDLDISRQLKAIQRNIRILLPPLHTPEEDEALTAKITNWRLATVDGLQHILSSTEAAARRATLIELLNAQLVAALLEHMQDPPPPGIEGGVHMIVELAVNLLLHLPGESRDVALDYYPPSTLLNPEVMRVETGIPPLVTPMAELSAAGNGASPPGLGGEAASSDGSSGSDVPGADDASSDTMEVGKDDGPLQGHAKKGLFGGLVGGGKSRTSPPKSAQLQGQAHAGAGGGGGSAAGASSQSSLLQGAGRKEEERVRLCVFLGLQVRGKMVLAKAPVYRL